MANGNTARLGWIGAGGIGLPMLTRLVRAGHRVTCFDTDPARRQLAAAANAAIAESPATVARESEAVFLSVPNGDVVGEVVFGRGGCVEGGMAGKLLIDTTSMDPVATRDYAARLAREGGRWLDAPVSGGIGGATDGKLVALIGGAPEDLEMARPWIACFAQRLVHLGPIGSGQWAKLCNQSILCGTIALWTEAFELGCKGGIDPHALVAALEGATSESRVRTTFGQELAAGTYMPSANLHKDIVTALKRADDGPHTMIASAVEVFANMRARKT